MSHIDDLTIINSHNYYIHHSFKHYNIFNIIISFYPWKISLASLALATLVLWLATLALYNNYISSSLRSNYSNYNYTRVARTRFARIVLASLVSSSLRSSVTTDVPLAAMFAVEPWYTRSQDSMRVRSPVGPHRIFSPLWKPYTTLQKP